MLVISEISDPIKVRHEALLERESYNYIPGSCVDIIMDISGSIYDDLIV